jgi:hypothetical protein
MRALVLVVGVLIGAHGALVNRTIHRYAPELELKTARWRFD